MTLGSILIALRLRPALISVFRARPVTFAQPDRRGQYGEVVAHGADNIMEKMTFLIDLCSVGLRRTYLAPGTEARPDDPGEGKTPQAIAAVEFVMDQFSI